MSSTAGVELYRVRRLVGDRALSDPALSGSTLEELLYDGIDEVWRRIGAGDVYQTGFATVGPTSITVTISSSYPAMRHLKHLVRESDGVQLQKTTLEAILNARAYGGSEFGPPREYALTPLADETMRLDTHPIPSSTETLTAVWEPFPAAVSQVTGTISMSPTALVALRTLVASRALLMLSPEKRVQLGISDEYPMSLKVQSDAAITEEWGRIHQGETQDFIMRARR